MKKQDLKYCFDFSLRKRDDVLDFIEFCIIKSNINSYQNEDDEDYKPKKKKKS